MKTKRIPFNLEKAKAGAKVVTRNGLPVRIVDYHIKNEDCPILGLVLIEGKEFPLIFTKTGNHYNDAESCYDIFIEEEEEEKLRREYSGTDSIYVPKDDEGIREELIDAINGLWDNDALPMPLSMKRKDAWLAWLEKQGVEKPADNKPKFQKGDWVIDKQGRVQKITDVRENIIKHTYEYNTISYSFDILSYGYFTDRVKDTRLWNIKDAKDGDILCYETKNEFRIFIYDKGCIHYHCLYYNGHLTTVDCYFVLQKHQLCYIHPATKEQRDFLFQKLKEAGYEWNFDKKELKKIEKVKTRRMTNQELSWWLREHPEEHREMTYSDEDNYVSSDITYLKSEANIQVYEKIVIRKNGGEWQEPLIEMED